jgi:putative aminopeptidase FrvX
MRLAAYTQLALAGVDGLGVALGPARHLLWPAVAGLSIPGLLVFLLNLEIVLRNEIVPGANDNLSGCAGLALLANRLVATRPDDVELVFVIAGAEEAGTGGSRALAHQMRDEWSPSDTIVLGVDGLSGGELCYFHEGDIFPLPIAPWLRQQIEDLAASQPRFAQVAVHEMDVGATDAGPFQAAGYDAVCIGRVDRALGSPRHYHHPTDTPDNLDMDEVLEAVDFIELLVNRIIDARRGPGSKI